MHLVFRFSPAPATQATLELKAEIKWLKTGRKRMTAAPAEVKAAG